MNISKFTKLSQRKILPFINKADICNLATYDNQSKTVDLIPIWYVFLKEDCQLNFYFIIQARGNTLNNLSYNNISSLSILIPYSNCEYNYFISIIAKGNTCILEDKYTDKKILKLFIDKYGYNNSLFTNCKNKDFNFMKLTASSLTSRLY